MPTCCRNSPLCASAGDISNEAPRTKNQERPSPTASKAARITGKGFRSLRRKLRLSAAEFGRLLNVSGPAVYLWEKRNGPLRVHQSTRTAILSIRAISAPARPRRTCRA